jgi:hypothetical protein
MRRNLETLRYTTIAPSRYTVYLSAAEHARLEGILPRLRAETIRALSEEIARLNRASGLRHRVDRWFGRARPALQNADTHWHVDFLPDADGDLQHDQDIIVHSDLILPAEPELGGERTRRITTVHAGATTTSRAQVVATKTSDAGAAGRGAPWPAPRARLTYQDARGRHEFTIAHDSITIGRGGASHPVDVRVSGPEDVSRVHAKIRRDPGTGAFHLVDLSALGTTLDGRHVPRGVDEVDGVRRENGAESVLPDRARIGLAEAVFLDFERVQA